MRRNMSQYRYKNTFIKCRWTRIYEWFHKNAYNWSQPIIWNHLKETYTYIKIQRKKYYLVIILLNYNKKKITSILEKTELMSAGAKPGNW